jgi:hypothetical protein
MLAMLRTQPAGPYAALQQLAQHAALAAQNGQPAPLGLDHAKLQQLARMLQVCLLCEV